MKFHATTNGSSLSRNFCLRSFFDRCFEGKRLVFAATFATAAILSVFAFTSNVNAATFLVNSQSDVQDATPGNGVCETAAGNGICTLRAAITEANALAGADVITLPAGTYTETLAAANENANAGGDFDITSPITINGAGAATTIIQANAAAQTANERVFHILTGGTAVTISGVTIRNGVNRNATAIGGGGIRAEGATTNFTLSNSTVTNNLSESRGGGIAANKASIAISNSTFANNQAGSGIAGSAAAGGGIVIDSEDNIAVAGQTANISNTVVSNNKAESSVSNTFGGGVFIRAVNAQIALNNCTINNNSSTSLSSSYTGYTGGIYNQQARVTLTNSTVSGNTATRFFAGVRNLASTQSSATFDIINSTVSNNTSADDLAFGGGIGNVVSSAFNATVNVDRSTISGNTLPGNSSFGAGIVNSSTGNGTALLNVTNSTIDGNSSYSGAAIYTTGNNAVCNINFSTITANATINEGSGIFGSALAGTIVSNTILADNTVANGAAIDVDAGLVSGDYNHIEHSAPGFVPAAHDVVNVDLQMGLLANNGGSTQTRIPGFPARNAIPFGTNGCGSTVTVDQRFFARPGFGACDKGSVELGAGEGTPTPTNTPTGGATNTPSNTPTTAPTNTATNTATFTPTPSATSTSTATNTPTPTATFTSTNTATNTPTPTATNTFTPTNTATNTPTPTATSTFTPTNSATSTPTPAFTATSTFTPTPTSTIVFTPSSTSTSTPVNTATNTATPVFTSTFTPTRTSTNTPTATSTSTATFTPTPTSTATRTSTSTPTATATVANTPTSTATATITNTATPAGTPSGIPVVLPNVNATPGLILIPITVGNTTGQAIISYDLNVDFNPAIIQPASPPVEPTGTLSSTMSLTPNSNNPGHLIVSAFQGVPLDGSGTLIFLRFNVVGTLGQSTTLVFADYTDPSSVFHPGFAFNEGDPQAATTNGSVTISTGATATNTPTASPTPTPGISGIVTYGNAIGAPAIRYVNSVNVHSTSGSPSMSAMTDTQGAYLLTGFGAGSYIITPSREDDTSGAITAFDAALIAQHTLGFQPLLTGIPLAVADVSGNGSVNSFDAGLIASFVNASTFPHGLTSGWSFLPASRSYASISGQISGQNYTALLMGDVSGSWSIPGARPDGGLQRQSAVTGNANVDLPNMTAASGKEVVVPVHVQGAANKGVISCQFVLRYDPAVIQPAGNPVEVLGTVGRGLTTKANAIEPGVLRVVMYGPLQIDQNGVLLNLRFTTVGAIGSVSPLTWERIMFNEGEPQVVAADGKIEIGGSW